MMLWPAAPATRLVLSTHDLPAAIAGRTTAIYEAMLRESQHIRRPNFEKIGTDDLDRLFRLYDEHFFGGWLFGRFATRHRRMNRKTFRTDQLLKNPR